MGAIEAHGRCSAKSGCAMAGDCKMLSYTSSMPVMEQGTAAKSCWDRMQQGWTCGSCSKATPHHLGVQHPDHRAGI